jgi:hypothetical protein
MRLFPPALDEAVVYCRSLGDFVNAPTAPLVIVKQLHHRNQPDTAGRGPSIPTAQVSSPFPIKAELLSDALPNLRLSALINLR